MTLKLELSPEREAALKAAARAQGISAEQWLQRVVEERLRNSRPADDTTTHAGKMIMTVFAGIAEFERDLIRERTAEGRNAAMKRGCRLLRDGSGVRELAKTFDVHPATIYRLQGRT